MLSGALRLILHWEKCRLIIRKQPRWKLFSRKVKHKGKQVKLPVGFLKERCAPFCAPVANVLLEITWSTTTHADFHSDLGLCSILQRYEDLYSLLVIVINLSFPFELSGRFLPSMKVHFSVIFQWYQFLADWLFTAYLTFCPLNSSILVTHAPVFYFLLSFECSFFCSKYKALTLSNRLYA